jgi:hypothetical protein
MTTGSTWSAVAAKRVVSPELERPDSEGGRLTFWTESPNYQYVSSVRPVLSVCAQDRSIVVLNAATTRVRAKPEEEPMWINPAR